jgi:DNA repair exonuclease SbcCD ATPase subunit
VGISSRGAGSTVKRKGREEVNERDFRFSGFDFVTDPSAHNAFPKVAEEYKTEMANILTESAGQIMETPESQKYFCELLTKIGCTDADMLGQCGLQPLTEDMQCTCPVDEKNSDESSLSPVAKKLQEVREEGNQSEGEPSEVDIKFEAVVLEEANTKIEELETELDHTKAKLEKSNERLLKMEADYRDMYLRSQGTTEDEDTEEKPDDLSRKVESLETDLDEFSQRVADLSEINENLSRTTTTQETQVNDLTEKVETLDLALTEAEQARDALQESVEALKKDKSGLMEKVVGLKSKVANIREDNTELYARYQAARLRLDEAAFVARIKELRPHTRAQIREVGKVLHEEVLHKTGSLGPLPSFEKKDIIKVEITENRDPVKKGRLKKIIRNT